MAEGFFDMFVRERHIVFGVQTSLADFPAPDPEVPPFGVKGSVIQEHIQPSTFILRLHELGYYLPLVKMQAS